MNEFVRYHSYDKKYKAPFGAVAVSYTHLDVYKRQVYNSVIFPGVTIEKDAVVRDSIIMSGSSIGIKAAVNYSIIAQNTKVGQSCTIGSPKEQENSQIAVIGEELNLSEYQVVPSGAMQFQDI